MAAVVKLEYLYKIIETEALSYYEVTDGRDVIQENQSCDSPDAAIEELRELFENLEDSTVTVKLCDKNKKDRAKGGKNHKYREYKVRLKSKQSDALGIAGGSVVQYLERINELQRQIDNNRLEREIEELKRKLESKKEDNPVLEKGLAILSAYLSKGQPAALAGHNDPPLPAAEVETPASVVKKAIARLAKVDPNLPETLTMLADFAEKKPAEFLAFIPIVKSQIP